MKASIATAALLLLGAPAFAGDITSTHVVQTGLTVDAMGTTNQRLASSVSMAGENIDVTSLPAIGAGAAGTAAATTAGVTAGVLNAGQPFQYSESAFAGSSSAAMTPTIGNATPGVLSALGGADLQTVTSGGTAGTLAATNLATGAATITAGGTGTNASILRQNVLSVFQ